MSSAARFAVSLVRLPGPAGPGPLPPGTGWLEVRADLAGDPSAAERATLAAAVRAAGGEGLIYTLRSRAEGGEREAGAERTARILAAAAAADAPYALIDLEAERDTTAEILAAVPPERRLLSWHGRAPVADELERRFAAMEAVPARFYKLVPRAVQPGEELAPLALAASLRRDDVIAFAGGAAGLWTRLLAPRLGAPVVYAALDEDLAAAPGQPSVARLVEDYGLPELRPIERLFGLVGRPVTHSLSPRLHNRAYRELGIPALYLPFHAEHFGDFWLEVVEGGLLPELGWPISGLSVTAPYKAAALAVAGAWSPRAQAIGAANTLVASGGVWEAESTDPEGVVLPVRRLGLDLEGLEAAVVGAGGAGRSAVVGLRDAGARVTLANRSRERGEEVAARFRVPFVPLAELEPERYALVVQATTLGRGADDPLPFDPRRLPADAVVVDLVYGEAPTPLLEETAAAGRAAVDGREVLLYQALEQFRMMTGLPLPQELARAALGIASPA